MGCVTVTEERRLWVTEISTKGTHFMQYYLYELPFVTTANSLIAAQEGSKHVADKV
jgi:hypothetical protein